MSSYYILFRYIIFPSRIFILRMTEISRFKYKIITLIGVDFTILYSMIVFQVCLVELERENRAERVRIRKIKYTWQFVLSFSARIDF